MELTFWIAMLTTTHFSIADQNTNIHIYIASDFHYFTIILLQIRDMHIMLEYFGVLASMLTLQSLQCNVVCLSLFL